MEVLIKIGKNPNNKTIKYNPTYNQNCKIEVEEMKKLLLSEENVTIRNATQYLIYIANSMILNSIIQKNKDLPDDLKNKPNLSPNLVKIIEIDDNGKENIIQDDNGMIKENYFNKLMGKVMDCYYEGLAYYKMDRLQKQ